MPFDWQQLERDESRRIRSLVAVLGATASALGLVSIVWGVTTRSDRWIDGIMLLISGLVVLGIGLRGRKARNSPRDGRPQA